MRRREVAVFMSFCELCFILIMMTCEVFFYFVLLLLFCLCFDDDILGSSDFCISICVGIFIQRLVPI